MILSPDFPDHYKTKILIRLAGHAGVFSLIKLWSQCQFRRSERLDKSPEIVAAIADWDGDPMVLEHALIESGFARRDGDALVMHQWQEENGLKGGRPKNSEPKSLKKRSPFKL